ncbi:MAG TPA: alginate export family protein [Planctomycetota bacterium]|nr:alginate export family protein [Planctomycetota bacterium]
MACALAASALGGEPPPAKAEGDTLDKLRTMHVGGAVFQFGFEERLRVEHWNNEDLNRHADDEDHRWFNRTRLRMDTIFNDVFRTRVELVDGREWESDREPRPQVDELDLHQAYVEIGGKPLMVRLGRQELDLGSRKLVAAPSWGNLLRSFDAARISYTSDLVDVHAFCGSVVAPVDDQFNEHRHGERVCGVFATLKPVKDHKIDLYAIRLHTWNDDYYVTGEDKVKGEHKRTTYGTHLFGNITRRWTYDVEGAIQRGHYAHDRIRAWAFHADTAYTLDLPWQPTIQPVVNIASGDRDPGDGVHGTFYPLYGSTHGMYGGIADQITWMNARVIGLRLRAKPVPKLTVGVEAHRYWLDDDKDAWYSTSKKAKRRDTTGKSGDHIGCELSFWAKYAVSKRVEFEGGISRFFAGRFVERTGPDDGTSFCYLQATFRCF